LEQSNGNFFFNNFNQLNDENELNYILMVQSSVTGLIRLKRVAFDRRGLITELAFSGTGFIRGWPLIGGA
jgi:hypothetical protein